MTRGAARAFASRLNNQPAKAQEINDPVTVAFLRHLESRGIGKYLADEPPEPVDRRQALRDLAEWNRNLPQYEADLKARRKAEAEAARIETLTPAQRLAEAVRDSAPHSDHIPLNGAGVLKALLEGVGGGTINGSSA